MALISCGGSDKPAANSGATGNAAATANRPASGQPQKGGPSRGGASFGDFAKKEAVKVDVYTLTPGRIAEYQVASGLVEAVDRAPVFSRVSELCTEVLVEEGQRVQAGDVLARVRDIHFVAEHAKAKSEHAKAQLRAREAELKYIKDTGYYERIQRVASESKDRTIFNRDEVETARMNTLTSKSAWDIAVAEVTEAELQVEVAQRDLQDCQIRSPIDGIVVRRAVEPFDKLSQDQHVFQIAQLAQMRVLVNVPETASSALSKNTPRRAMADADMHAVLLKATAYPGERFLGYIHAVAPVIDSDRGMLPLETRLVPLPWVAAAASFDDSSSNADLSALLTDARSTAGHMSELAGGPLTDLADVRQVLTKVRQALDQFPPPVRRSILATSAPYAADGKARNLPELRPGMWVEASVVTKSNPAALVVPTTAIVKDSVFVVQESTTPADRIQGNRRPSAGATEPNSTVPKLDVDAAPARSAKPVFTVKRIDVTGLTGISSEGFTELRLSTDIRAGVRVVWRGLDYLKDGDSVEVMSSGDVALK